MNKYTCQNVDVNIYFMVDNVFMFIIVLIKDLNYVHLMNIIHLEKFRVCKYVVSFICIYEIHD